MNLSPIFKLRSEATPEIIKLLESVTLGTNGAQYRHLDTKERIHTADNPLHLSMERNNRVIGNVTFCKRNATWYVRYFAFDTVMQGAGKAKSKSKSGGLKREIQDFFNQVIRAEQPFGDVNSLYAYIDPNNEKSLWMSETFGFKSMATIATQTFSRVGLPKQTDVEEVEEWELVAPVMRSAFEHYQYYFEDHLKQGPFYVIRDDENEIIACCKITRATWAIERLPGKLGGVLPKIIPLVPGLRKIIRPKKHAFLVPEAVFVKDDNPKLLEALFEGVLAQENKHLLLWWIDETVPLYQVTRNTVNWGMLHRLVGVNQAHLMVKHNDRFDYDKSSPVYTCGFDFV